ncbi:MAG: Gfo/Idh/MocA family oxidoreductase [Verrucomicrobiota bacterium]|nr:Gfo/Idh/MocA family oxidoreductase [Verrucomicrobiota bacterium]
MSTLESTPKIRCGVVGVGYLGQHHARIYSQLPGVEFVGLYDANPARAAEIQAQHGGRIFATVEELGAACEAISVAVPTDKHRDVALPLLKQGCHLLIEKPLCASLSEAEQILAAAKQANAVVQVGHIEHFNPVMGFLEQAVTEPRFITADRLAPFNPRGTEVGVVLDLMIHDIGIILELVKSPIVRVDSVGVSVLSRSEDIANARLTFANGCVANINTSRVSEKKLREIRVFQSSAYLSFDFMNQTGHLVRRVGATLQREDIPLVKDEPLKLELASFVECVRNRADPKVNAELGKSALELAIQITEQLLAGMRRG